MSTGSQRSDQLENVNFEPIIRGLKSDIFDLDQAKIRFYLSKIQLQKKKVGKKRNGNYVH